MSEQFTGGWQQPSTPGSWRQPEQAESQTGWRVPTLPQDLEEVPVVEGVWHLPRPEDTVFSPEDEIEVTEKIPTPDDVLRPEDLIFGDVTTPEQQTEDEGFLAPEDLIYMIEHEDGAEAVESVGMSELVALASLVKDDIDAEVIAGADSPIPEAFSREAEEAVDEEDSTEIEAERLSPAERLIFETGATEIDPAEYARRQLEQLGQDPEAVEQPQDDELDPAAYARRQLEQLGDIPGRPAISTEDPAEYARRQLEQLDNVVGERLDPRQQELLRRFQETEEQVRQLRASWRAGQMSQGDFLQQLRDLMILDDDQVWWMMGVETDTWYRSENNQWVEDTPEVLRIARGAPSATGGFQADYGQFGGIEDEFIPFPQQDVPLNDPGATVPSAGVFDNLGQQQEADYYGQETVPNPAFSGPTVMAEPVSYGTIENAIDLTEAPAYDQVDLGGEYHREAVERQRASIGRTLIFATVIIVGLSLLAAAGYIAAAVLWYNGLVSEWEDQLVALQSFEPEFQTVTLRSSTGDVLTTLSRDGDDRRPVDLNQVSPFIVHAVLSLEDPDFYDDTAWDIFGIMGAFWQNFVGGGVEPDTSPITRQVARRLILQDAALTADGALNEAIVTTELTDRYDHNRILELYLNEVVFFGNQTYGVEAAAQFYFEKAAADLNLAESALLAAIIPAPAEYEPVNNPVTALDQMDVMLNRMAATGCIQFQHAPYLGEPFCVTPELVQNDPNGNLAAEKARVILRVQTELGPRMLTDQYPHFVQLVRAQLEALFGPNQLYAGGYEVTTTLDVDLQEFAQEALADAVEQHAVRGVNTGTVVVTDPRSGAILALVGSPDFTNTDLDGENDFSRLYQQPGGMIKPIVYATALSGVDFNGNGALERGEYHTPASILWDVPTQYANFTPVNRDGQFRGAVPLRSALQNDLDVPAIKEYEYVGENAFRNMAEAMGIRFANDAQFNITTALGTASNSADAIRVRPIDMMEVYGTIANYGNHVELFTIQSIVDRNGSEVALPVNNEPTQVLDRPVAYLLQNILSDNQSRSDQFDLNSPMVISGLPTQNVVGAKSGTSIGGSDLWTAGFTNNRVVTVWMGTVNDGQTFETSGVDVAGPVWNAVMRKALEDNPPGEFRPPEGVATAQICALTGTLPDDTCAVIRNEFFAQTRQPPPPDQGFSVQRQVDSWTGLLANNFCPENVVTRSYVDVQDPYAIQWLNGAGQNYAQRVGLNPPIQSVPQQACDQNTPIPVVRLSSPGGGQSVQGSVAIIGQVSAQDFSRYQIELAPVTTPGAFSTIIGPVQQQQPGAGSTLGTWNTTTLANGEYTLRLAVFANNGGFVFRNIQVTVNNPDPTATPTVPPTIAPTAFPTPFPTQPLPFDTLTPIPGNQAAPGGPTPTIDPLN